MVNNQLAYGCEITFTTHRLASFVPRLWLFIKKKKHFSYKWPLYKGNVLTCSTFTAISQVTKIKTVKQLSGKIFKLLQNLS